MVVLVTSTITAVTSSSTTVATFVMLCMFGPRVQREVFISVLLSHRSGGQAGLQGDAAAPRASSPSDSHSQAESHPDFGSRFLEQHQIRNSIPMGQAGMFAEPLISQQQPASQQHQAQAMSHGPSDQMSAAEVQTSDTAHDFPWQHRVHDAAPADQQSMFAEPLASDQQEGHQDVQSESAQHESSTLAHSSVPQHAVSSSLALDEEHLYSQPLQSDQQRDNRPSTEASATHHQSSPDEGSADSPGRQAQALASGQHLQAADSSLPGAEPTSAAPASGSGPHHSLSTEASADEAHADRAPADKAPADKADADNLPGDEAPTDKAHPGDVLDQAPAQLQQQQKRHTTTAGHASENQRSTASLGEVSAPQAAPFASQHSIQNEAPAEQSRYAQPLASDEGRHGFRTAAQTSSFHGQQDFASQHSLQSEAPAEVSRYAEPLTSDQRQDRDSSAGGEQGFPTQHSIHNAVPADGSMYDQPLTSSEQHTQSPQHSRASPRSSEHGTGLPPSSEHGRSQSGDPSTVDDLTSAHESVSDREAPAAYQQQPVSAQSRQEGFGSEQLHGGQGEGVGCQQPGVEDDGVQGQHSNAAQLATSQRHHEQPQEQLHEEPHQSLPGCELVSRLLCVAMMWNQCSAETAL